MSLTWRDAVGTVLVAGAMAASGSVIFGWNWPLLGDARAGAIALLILSYPSCLVAQAPGRMAAAMRARARWNLYLVVATVLGATATLLILANLVADSLPILIAAAAVVLAIWVVTTTHHAIESGNTSTRRLSAA